MVYSILEISATVFSLVFTTVNIVQGIYTFHEMRRNKVHNLIAEAVDYTWSSYVKETRKK